MRHTRKLDSVNVFAIDALIPPWMRKSYVSSQFIVLGCAKVIATSYPITLKIISKENLLCSYIVNNNNSFRLPKIPMVNEFDVEIDEGNGVVTDLFIAGSMNNLRYGG